MCDLLRGLPGWEAIKTSRGHYRSCGKDPHACCVSDLIGEAPVIRSGKTLTYESGKDTGRYWEAGAANVHWLIATDEQVATGVREVLKRVKAPGVLIEGNSFSKYVRPHLMVMVAGAPDSVVKKTAREALLAADFVYSQFPIIESLKAIERIYQDAADLPVIGRVDIPILLDHIRDLLSQQAATRSFLL